MEEMIKIPAVKPMPYKTPVAEKKRMTEFDLLKFLAMSFVVIPHVLQRIINGFTTTWTFAVFYSVSMSLFMFAGGYFIKRTDKLKDLILYILKKILVYLYPAVLFTIITVLTIRTYSAHDVLYWLNEFVLRTDSFYWYMVAAFFIDTAIAIGYFIANKIVGKGTLLRDIFSSILNVIFAGAVLSPFIYLYSTGSPAVLSSNLILYLAPACMIGFLFKTFAQYFAKLKKKTKLIIRSIVFALAFIGYATSMYFFQNWLSMPNTVSMIYHMLGSFAGVLCYYYLCLALVQTKVFQKCSEFGKYSMQLYLVHVLLLRAVTLYVSKITVFDTSAYAFMVSYVVFVLLGSLALSVLLTKWNVTDILLFGNYKRLAELKRK